MFISFSFFFYGILFQILFINNNINQINGAVVKRQINYDKTSSVGSDVELVCELSNEYIYGLSWTKLDGILNEDSEEIDGKLLIRDLKREDEGTYECSLPDGQSSRVRLSLIDDRENQNSENYNPDYSEGGSSTNHDQEKEVDSSVELTCDLSEQFGSQLKWNKIEGPKSKQSREHEGKLLIHYLTESDSGEYECRAPDGQFSRVRLIVKTVVRQDEPTNNENNQNHADDHNQQTTSQHDQHDDHQNNQPEHRNESDHQEEPVQDRQRQDEERRDENEEDSYQLRAHVEKSSAFLAIGQYEENTCTGLTNGNSIEVEWYNPDGRLIQDNGRIKLSTNLVSQSPLTKESQLIISKADYIDSGSFECKVKVGSKIETATFTVSIVYNNNNHENGHSQDNVEPNPQDNGEPNRSNYQENEERVDSYEEQERRRAEEERRRYEEEQRRNDEEAEQERRRVEEEAELERRRNEENEERLRQAEEEERRNEAERNRNEEERRNEEEQERRRQEEERRRQDENNDPRYHDDRQHENGHDDRRYEEQEQERRLEEERRRQEDVERRRNEEEERRRQEDEQRRRQEEEEERRRLEENNDGRYHDDRQHEDGHDDRTYQEELEKRRQEEERRRLEEEERRRQEEEEERRRRQDEEERRRQQEEERRRQQEEEERRRPEEGNDRRYHDDRQPEDGHDSRRHEDQGVTKACDIYEATCQNGQCIPRSGLCDGVRDCSDGTDENFCGRNNDGANSGRCEPNEKGCRNGKCIQKIWFCDGEKDCDDGSDETSCVETNTGGPCKSHEFVCRNGDQCILKSFVCDKEFDCLDRSDEIGCEPPRIIKGPVRTLTVIIGSTFKIECQASGFPAPYINWRLNWGHVCEEPRCYSTNSNGYGVLTVTDARLSDSGAYSCEAINSEGRIFAVPDSIVTVIIGSRPTTTTTTTQPPPPPEPEPETDCFCHNHTLDCTCSGRCLNCQHNTMGIKCEYCKPGYIGDATRGTPYDCVPNKVTTTPAPPPPLPIEESDCDCNNHTLDCTCSGKCLNCKHNTMGEKCQYCLPGFIGDATRGTPYDCLTATEFQYLQTCNPYGTSQISGTTCKCKLGVTGKYCDECKPRYYNLVKSRAFRKGCLSCFCNGLSVDCKSSDSYYRKIKSDFQYEHNEWHISDRYTQLKERVYFTDNSIVFNRFKDHHNEDLYFIAPIKYKGNKLLSYGGNLSFIYRYSGSNYHAQKLEIRISGNHVNILYVHPDDLKPNVENKITVNLHEDNFKRYGDNGAINREFMLLALSNIELIMIKAKLSDDQSLISLSEFSIDYADSKHNYYSDLHKADSVEICQCPVGYSGSSCESCAPGYQKSLEGFYWGLCESIY